MPKNICTVSDCEDVAVGLSLCSKHWQRFRKYGSTDLPEITQQDRFWAKVDKTDTCWNWTGHRKADGYGRWRVPNGTSRGGKQIYVHRVSWAWEHGDIPEGMQIDHRCHNTSCVRPSHLRMTTGKENQEHRISANAGNISGVRGVTRAGKGARWIARVRHNGRTHYAGSYATIAEAEAAVIAMRLELFTHNDLDRAA